MTIDELVGGGHKKEKGKTWKKIATMREPQRGGLEARKKPNNKPAKGKENHCWSQRQLPAKKKILEGTDNSLTCEDKRGNP